MKHYAHAAGIEYGSFTYLTDKLEKKGLIRRCAAQDKRCTTLCLTPEGTRGAKALRTQFDAHVANPPRGARRRGTYGARSGGAYVGTYFGTTGETAWIREDLN